MSGKTKPPGYCALSPETAGRIWKLYSEDHLTKTVIGRRFSGLLHYQTVAAYIRKREKQENTR